MRDIAQTLFGGLVGFALGALTTMGINMVTGLHLEGWPTFGGAMVGAVIGGWVARQGGAIAAWCAGMTIGVGGIAFACGFFGPIILHPDSPQGPLLGIFITGPLGAAVGALLGIGIGAVRRGSSVRGAG